jgi:hypothetical protein
MYVCILFIDLNINKYIEGKLETTEFSNLWHTGEKRVKEIKICYQI